MTNATMRKCNGQTGRGGQTRWGGSVKDKGTQLERIKLNMGVQYNREELEYQRERDDKNIDPKHFNDKITDRQAQIELLNEEIQFLYAEIQEYEDIVKNTTAHDSKLYECSKWFDTNIPDFALEDSLNEFQNNRDQD